MCIGGRVLAAGKLYHPERGSGGQGSEGSSALIRAEDDDHLSDLLDELADPADASWQVYEGPLWLEFPKMDEGLPAEGDMDPQALGLGKPEFAGSDGGYDSEQELLRLLHPTVTALRERTDLDEQIPRATVEAAIEADLRFGLASSIFGEPSGVLQ